MQMVIRLFIYGLTALLALVLFAPKKELYFLLEKELQSRHVVLADESLKESPFGLTLQDLRIRVDGAEVAELDRITLRTFLLYNRLTLQGLRPAPGMERLLPITVEKGMATYTLLHPTRLQLDLQGSFGKAKGYLQLLPLRHLHLEIVQEGNLDTLRPYLKRENGRWLYDAKF